MTAPSPEKRTETSFSSDLVRAFRYYLRGRRGWIALGGIAVVAGLAFNWDWLVTAGIAPLLISVLPCVAMCAVGVCCMNKTAGQSTPEPTVGEDSSNETSAKDD